MAGNESEEDTKIYKEIIFNNVIERYLDRNKIIIGNDTRIGLAAGSDSKNGIMIIYRTRDIRGTAEERYFRSKEIFGSIFVNYQREVMNKLCLAI